MAAKEKLAAFGQFLKNEAHTIKNDVQDYFSRLKSRMSELNADTDKHYADRMQKALGTDINISDYDSFKKVAVNMPSKMKNESIYDKVAKHASENPDASYEDKKSVVREAMADANARINKMNGVYLERCTERVCNFTRAAVESGFESFKTQINRLGGAIQNMKDRAKADAEFKSLSADLAGTGFHLEHVSRDDITGDKAVNEIKSENREVPIDKSAEVVF